MTLRLVALMGTLGLLPAGLRMLMPAMLTAAEILLGIGQAGLTLLRTAAW